MNHTRHLALILLQCVLLLVLAAALIRDTGNDNPLVWAAVTALAATTVLLLVQSRSSSAGIRRMADDLSRAAGGNWKTRLLANEDRDWNEVIFTINELIEQLEQLQVSAVKSEAARKSLLSGISHDIRTPLTSIIGYLDALKDDVPATEQERQQYLDIVSAKANALKEMIDEMFTMARLDADELPLTEEVHDFAEIVRETVIGFMPELKKHGMEPHIRIPEHPCPIIADRLSIARIINNIVKNAIRHGQEGKTIGIELCEHGHEHERNREYRLHIWDSGPGIAPADLPRVFERNFRGDRARTTGSGGSGLGLSIAKALTEKHRGRIWAESEPWKRTSFVVAIPKAT
ncbi:sensor histidine kinase [Paenibacillus thermotolerans]|uniref:sensor histidine kinase n=1 Tax=Paenibacillus thermotolerans TaxID=3027807 RepID=UPI0023683F37|nr:MULTISPECIES: HAMP domain-containing sensor histidine kinase [unclassified Paenibacillus]